MGSVTQFWKVFFFSSITGWTFEGQITKWHNVSSSIAQNEEASGGDTHQSPDEMPRVTRRLLPARRLRKRALAVEDRETGEFTLMDFVFWITPDVFFFLLITLKIISSLVPRFRFGLSDSRQACHASQTRPVGDWPHDSSKYNSPKHLLTHCAICHAQQRECVQQLSSVSSTLCAHRNPKASSATLDNVLLTSSPEILPDPKIYCETNYCKY